MTAWIRSAARTQPRAGQRTFWRKQDDYKLECLTCEKRLAQFRKKEALEGSDSSFSVLTGRSLISTAVFRNSASPERAFDNRSGVQGSSYKSPHIVSGEFYSGMMKFSVI